METGDFLAGFGKFGINLGLERIDQLLQDLGSPHQKVPTVHVAGTNGKGSVCAFLSQILQNAGFRVGRYISPHLIDWRERITINGKWIAENDFKAALAQVDRVILAEHLPSQFEVITAAAWWYFAQQKVDIAIIETGLGGRLDATNVVEPLVAVITSISMDHWQRLGNTLAAIAGEKAGIIKHKRPVVVGELPREAELVIAQKARHCEAEITWVKAAIAHPGGASWQGLDFQLGLLGKHQLINSALAIATIQVLQSQGWKISETVIQTGLAGTKWLGRLQILEYNGQQIWLDGAHNLAAAAALRSFFDQSFPQVPRSWVIGILATKDWRGMLQAILEPGDRLYAVPVPDRQTCDPEDLAIFGSGILNYSQSFNTWQEGLATALAENNGNPAILCGSLYLVGACLQSQKFDYE
jgi:dihydrofolate synthase / folylpolyglutamate synthase